MILSLTGPSGVGKTTLLLNLLKAIPEAKPLESVTTRAPRPTDEPNFKYVSPEEFKEREEKGEFLWTAKTYVNLYATRKVMVDRALDEGVYLSILVLDAAKKLYDYAKLQHKTEVVHFFYLEIDDETELRRRFNERNNMTKEEVESRIHECKSWNKEAHTSELPFVFLDGTQMREALLTAALHSLPLHTEP